MSEMKALLYVHGVLLLHHSGKAINKENLRNIIASSGIEPDTVLIDAMIDSLQGRDMNAFLAKLEIPSEAYQELKEDVKTPVVEEKKVEEDTGTGLEKLFGD
jgi:ribosomal protein L12E/L44/L45/RPP1/RPP2